MKDYVPCGNLQRKTGVKGPPKRLALLGALFCALILPFGSPAQTCTPPPSGLISWWAGEGSGADSFGTNHGMLLGGVTFTNGLVGRAFSFDGVSGTVVVPDSSSLRITNQITIEAWINPHTTNGDQGIVSKVGGAAGNNGYQLLLSGNKLRALFNSPGDAWPTALLDYPMPIVLGTWYHVAWTYDQSVMKLYVNGQLAASNNIGAHPITASSSNLRISCDDNNLVFFNGLIDEPSIYNTALTAAQIQTIYLAGSAGKCAVAPTIVSQPTGQTVPAGLNVTFSVGATGSAPLGYQWKLNGSTAISNATNSSLTLTNVQPGQSGNLYSVTVSNAASSTNSTSALLTVNPPSCTPPLSGLISWWAGEGSGADSFGTNHGTLSGGASFTNGMVGQAFSFDGVNGTVVVPDSASLRLTNQITIEAWINPLTTNGDQGIVSKIGGVGGNNGYQLLLQNNVLAGLFNSPGQPWPSWLIQSPLPLTLGTWNHVAWTYDQSDMKLYFNGQLVGSNHIGAQPITVSSSNLRISGDENNHVYFNGLIDEPSIYNTALSAAQIQAIYLAGSAGKCAVAPTIVSQPAGQTTPVGSNVTFSVSATGSAPLGYQWKLNGSTVISNATNSSLTISNVQLSQSGNLYSVTVFNPGGSTNSTSALLTVNPTTCTAAPAGLISWWAGEGSAADSFGTNHGTLQGGVSFTNGEVGRAFSFDGTNGTVVVPDSTSLEITNQITIEAWINTRITNGDNSIVSKVSSVSGNNGFEFALEGNQLLGQFNSPGQTWPSEVVQSPVPIVPGTWHHVAWTYDQSVMKLYYDSQLVATNMVGPYAIATSSAAVRISGVDNHVYFDGMIDEPSIYSVALSAAQIQAIYLTGSYGKCAIPPTIVSQPAGQIAPVGGNATFSVSATGSPPLGYQWKLNGSTVISNATNSSLTISNVQPVQSGNLYSVTVFNTGGSTNSTAAALTVNTGFCTPPPSGLVSLWPGEGSAADSFGTNNGLLENGVSFTAGVVGSAFNFNGTNQYVRVPQAPSLNVSNQVTIDFWMNADPSTPIGSKLEGLVTADFYGIEINSSGPRPGLYFYLSTNRETSYSSSADLNGGGMVFPAGQWHHVAATYDGAKIQMYLDGQQWGNPVPATGNISPMLPNSFLTLGSEAGRACNCASRDYHGLLDEIDIFNRALSASEIQAIFAAGSFGKCTVPPTIVDQPVGQTVPAGSTVTFSVVAAGNGPLGYQWTLNGSTVISNATNSSLTLTNVQLGQSGNLYSVTVFNTGGSTNSTGALLTVTGLSCTPPPSGLISWWAGENNAADSFGTNNGTLQGGVTFTNGVVGQALSFNGVNGTVVVPDSSSLRITNQITIEAWINPRTTNGDQGIVSKVGGAAGNNGYQLLLSGNKLRALFNSPGDAWPTALLDYPMPIVLGTWYHVAWTYDQSVMKLYVNGQLAASNNIGAHPITVSSSNLRISCDDNNLVFFNGLIDEPSIYNTALTAAQIQAIYLAGSAGKCAVAPTIVSQPAGQTIPAGTSATFTVVATGSAPLGYQWKLNGNTVISNATNASLTISNVQPGLSGNLYSVTVSNSVGSTNSTAALLTVTPASCTAAPPGLVDWWPGDGNASDIVGGLNGILANGTGFAAGEVGQAFSFNGTNQYVTNSMPGLTNITNSFTMEFWAYPTAARAVTLETTTGISGISNQRYAIYPNWGNDAAGVGVSVGTNGVSVFEHGAVYLPSILVYNTPIIGWTHIAVVYSNQQPSLYLNGVLVHTGLKSPRPYSYPSTSLGEFGTVYGYYAGLLDEVSIYNRSLSPSEIQTIFQAGSAGKCKPSTPNFSTLQALNTTSVSNLAVVPINLIAEGNENTFQFSLNFDPTFLTFTGASLGSNAGGALLLSNVTQLASGKLGLGVALPPNSNFPAGTQQVLKVSFSTAPVFSNTITLVSFGDLPTPRQIVNAQAGTNVAFYTSGAVTLPFAGFEADVLPATNGDGAVTAADWVEVGRLVAGLDAIATNSNQFQRADCAPRSTLGDGMLTVSDWVQAGRYSIGLDPLTPAGGPTGPFAPVFQPLAQANDSGRTITAVGATVQAGQVCHIPIQLTSQGNENAAGFSMNFDPAVLTFLGADPGHDATGGILMVNSNQAGAGNVGVALALPSGTNFPASTVEIVVLDFLVAPSASNQTTLSFASQPVVEEVATMFAEPVAATYVGASLTVTPLVIVPSAPTLTIATTTNGNLLISWPASATGFVLESAGDPTSTNWSGVAGNAVTNASSFNLTIPGSNTLQFFRLRHP